MLEAGDFFGEMAILEDQPRFATVVARAECRCCRSSAPQFADVLRENVEIAVRIMRKLAARLRRSDQRAGEAHAALDEFKRRIASRAAASGAPGGPGPCPVPCAPARPPRRRCRWRRWPPAARSRAA